MSVKKRQNIHPNNIKMSRLQKLLRRKDDQTAQIHSKSNVNVKLEKYIKDRENK